MSALISYIVAMIVFVAIDLVWLTWVGGPLYRQILGDILAPSVRLAPALVFYVIYPAGLVMFAAQPGISAGQSSQAAMLGALFGFFTYATYDFTNYATLRNWTLGLTLIDIGWGCVLGAVTAAITSNVSPAILSWFVGRSA